jgi:hypothetical protein
MIPSWEERVFPKLKPGIYRVTGELEDHIQDTTDSTTDVPPGGCFSYDVRMVPDSVISGVVVTPEGQAVANARVGTEDMEPAVTDDQGRFQLRILQPGLYRISANAISRAGGNYAPWAPAIASGSPFRMGLTTHVDNVRIVLGQKLTARKLTVGAGRGMVIIRGWMPSAPDLIQRSLVLGGDPTVVQIWREMQYEVLFEGGKLMVPPGTADRHVER